MVFFVAVAPAETLESVLLSAGVPTHLFPANKLRTKITSYQASKGDPFLLAYYDDDGSGTLHDPMGLVRYSAASRVLKTTELRNLSAPFSVDPSIVQPCDGSVLSISESYGNVYVGTHQNPSAGCVLILANDLTFKTAVSGWLEGVIGADYVILHESEIHFMSVHPMRISVFDLARHKATRLYPPTNDPLREKYSSLIRTQMPTKQWCIQTASLCDPDTFDSDLDGDIAVNEAAKLFGFVAWFDAGGFGELALKNVPRTQAAYFFRLHDGAWESREFKVEDLQRLFGSTRVEEIVAQRPGAIFADHR
jgi:hypothetical protein